MIKTILVEAIDRLLRQGPSLPDCGICWNIKEPLLEAIADNYDTAMAYLMSINHSTPASVMCQLLRAVHRDKQTLDEAVQNDILYPECTRLMEETWQAWPEYSGVSLYPIPSGDSTLDAECDYDFNDDKWVGRRGELRRDLLKYMRKELTKGGVS